jgi:hypothetical protein
MHVQRLAVLALCLLPAFSLEVPARGGTFLASYLPACTSGDPRPRVETHVIPGQHFAPRPEFSGVEIFAREQPPVRRYSVIGSVRVLASSSRMPVATLEDWARREARRLGGDALIDLVLNDAARATPPAGPVGLMVLDARIVHWDPGAENAKPRP